MVDGFIRGTRPTRPSQEYLVVTILEAVSDTQKELTGWELSRQLAQTAPAIEKLVEGMVQLGWLRRDQDSERLLPGPRLYACAANLLATRSSGAFEDADH